MKLCDVNVVFPFFFLQEMTLSSIGFTILSAALLDPYVEGLLRTSRSVTFFAPSDKAFDGYSADERSELLSDSKALVKLIKRHIVVDGVYSTFVNEGSRYTFMSLAGGDIVLSKSTDGSFMVNGVAITSPHDVTTVNGVIHTIDKIL